MFSLNGRMIIFVHANPKPIHLICNASVALSKEGNFVKISIHCTSDARQISLGILLYAPKS